MKLELDSVKAWGLLIVGVVAGYAVYRAYKTGSAIADSVGETISDTVDKVKEIVTVDLNPASTGNVVYETVNGAVSDALGYEETLGGAIYDWLHPISYTEPDAGRIDSEPQAYSPEAYEASLGNAP